MPVSTHLVSAVTTNSIEAIAWSNTTDSNLTPLSNMTDIRMEFTGIIGQIPSGATIQGIELLISGTGNSGTDPEFSVNNDSSDSARKHCNTSWSKGATERTYGGSTDLWGLSWTHETAQKITATLNFASIGPARFFFNYIKVSVYYELASLPIKITSGIIKLTSGKISL